MAYFPMFIDLEKKRCLVAGGGTVAYRKVRVLMDFGADVVVIAPKVRPEICKLKGVQVIKRAFMENDLDDCILLVAATDDKNLNHRLAELAKAKKIAVNAVDQKEDCTFLFPAYVKEQNLIGAFSSGGNSPLLTQYLKQKFSAILTGELGEINEYMGSIRPYVRSRVWEEGMRSRVYRRILNELLTQKKYNYQQNQDWLDKLIEEVVEEEKNLGWNEQEG